MSIRVVVEPHDEEGMLQFLPELREEGVLKHPIELHDRMLKSPHELLGGVETDGRGERVTGAMRVTGATSTQTCSNASKGWAPLLSPASRLSRQITVPCSGYRKVFVEMFF